MSQNKLPSDFFIFSSPELAAPGEPEDAFAFTAAREIDIESLIEALQAHMDKAPPPGRLFLLGAEPIADKIVVATADDRLRAALPKFTRFLDPPPLKPLAFDRGGQIRRLSGEPDEVSLTEKVTREGLRWIFEERKGMLRAGPGFHYVNPSERHTTGFIRTGNVLLHSAEISFVAMGLLKWWPDHLRRIFVDTASISSVAYALIELRRLFDDEIWTPSIDSFSSYAGLKEFGFVKTDSLCLISASTSGSLHKKIVERNHLPSDRVVTLFYCGSPIDTDGILCDLTERLDQPGIAPLSSHGPGEDCEMCQRGSDVVRISGDQFLPADPEVHDLVLAAEHAPSWLSDFLGCVLGQGIVRCHGGMDVDGIRPREIFFQLEDAVRLKEAGPKETLRFPDYLQRQLDAVVPASLDAIVHANNTSSVVLAETVREYFSGPGERPPPNILNADSLLNRDDELKPGASVLVVAGATSSGGTLLGISQFLRNVAKARSIVYLIGVVRSSSEAEWHRLHSNLTWGRRKSDYPLSWVTYAHLPTEHSPGSSPWTSEMQFLGRVRDRISTDNDYAKAVEEIETRRKQINSAGSLEGGGLDSEVFLPRVKGDSMSFETPDTLELGPGFVFWAGQPPDLIKDPTQAEVYMTLAAILHHLRDGGDSGNALVQHEHNRTVLAPATFGRFNDGVIQAAILRAARPRELDYSHDKELSAQMCGMVKRFIQRRDQQEGEGAAEFLLALARQRIRLTDKDTEHLIEFLQEETLPPFMSALVRWMGGEPGAKPTGEEAAVGVA